MNQASLGSRRWLTLVTAVLAMFVVGVIYAYGVFLPVFMREYGWERSTAALPQSVQLFVYAVGMGLGGALQDRTNPTLIALAGSLVFAAGICLAPLSTSLLELALTLGLTTGLGFGFVYVSAVTSVLTSFPERRGLVAGVVVGAFGLGTFVWAPASQALLDSGMHWTRVFLLFGLSALVVLPLLSLGIRSPWRPHHRPGEHAGASGLRLAEALRTPLFWLVFAGYTLVTTAGLMWFAHFKAFGVSQGMSAAQAAFLASLTAVGGALGRLLMGYASDHIGRFPSLLGACALEIGLFIGFGFGVPHAAIFAFAALSGFAFGTWLALYGPTSTDLFGMRSAGSIYGALYLSYGIGGLAGPMLGGLLADLSGDYALAFFVMAGVCAAGGVLFLLAMLQRPPQFEHPPAAEEEFPV